MAFRNQVSSFVQSIPDDLWQIPPMNQLAWLRYFKDLKPDHGFLSWVVTHFNPNTMVFRFEDSEVTPTYEEMCAVMGHHPEQDETSALPPGPRYDLAKIVALYPVYLPDDRSMAYFPDRISRQYGMIRRDPRIHDFESGLMTPSFLIHMVDRWRNRNTRYLGQGVMKDTVTPEYVHWFYAP
ncbi:hypothetical protein JCGZ_24440 [Jatropha curcas]|uniref:Aminotransferase-like plant mobile domain-containing protein n=1 Tax=Jatropha curcas TaxID=180498 RepID=A0A067JM22_JATCU|nr:hypothetical protein JCGZ_24440 [Jatropha curcas]